MHSCSVCTTLITSATAATVLCPVLCVPPLQITAGEQIDAVFGAKLGLSSMAAAGLGNTVADVVGINISHTIEQKFKGMQSMSPGLTKAQLKLPQTRRELPLTAASAWTALGGQQALTAGSTCMPHTGSHTVLLLDACPTSCCTYACCCLLLLVDGAAGAKWLGCAIGMAAGCLLGLTPLLFHGSEHHQHDEHCREQTKQQQPAAAGAD